MDVLLKEYATDGDFVLIDGAVAFDYTLQVWRQADHAHFVSDDSELLFCGATREHCGHCVEYL